MVARLNAKVHRLFIGALTKYGFTKQQICLDVDGVDGVKSIEATSEMLQDPDIIACLNAGVLECVDNGEESKVVQLNADEQTDAGNSNLSTEQKALFDKIDNLKSGPARDEIVTLTDVVLLSELAVHAKKGKVQAFAKEQLEKVLTVPSEPEVTVPTESEDLPQAE